MSIIQAEIYWNEAGTPVSTDFDDVYFSNRDGLSETRYVFIEQNKLIERWKTFEESTFTIAETGFGTGLNFLATCYAFTDFKKKHPKTAVKKLRFISIEKFPLSKSNLEKIHQHWPELSLFSENLMNQYPVLESGCHRIFLFEDLIELELWFADVKDALPQIKQARKRIVDAWYLDGFAPKKNAEMWTNTLFMQMAMLARHDCTLATFTAAGFVRRGLCEAGFAMEKVKGYGSKREMLIGTFKLCP